MNQLRASEEAREQLAARLTAYGIPACFVEDLVSRHKPLAFEKGSRLFLRGAPANLLFLIFSGLTKVYFPRPDGTRVLVHLGGPSDLIGNVNYIDPQGRRVQSFEVEALTRCTVALLTREHVGKALRALEPAHLLQVLEGLNTAWSASAQRFAIFFGMTFRQRLEFTLRELGTRFGVRDSRGVLLMPELTQTDLAEMIGCSRPMISRLIGDMKDDGLLLNECRRFVLLDHRAAE
jgi:CRP/FNR family cyclic AMP-dependent transcriptional regulator